MRVALRSLVIAVLTLAACTTAPVQEMSDARQAVTAAREAGAARRAPDLLNGAEASLQNAQELLRQYQYQRARQLAETARDQAVRARERAVTQQADEQRSAAAQAIVAARGAVRELAALHGATSDMEKLLEQADQALRVGDFVVARTQAACIEHQARSVANQIYLTEARALIDAARQRHGFKAWQRATLRDARAALDRQEGKKAYQLVKGLSM